MDPKLIAARGEIQAILERLDIAGHVVLHNAPGAFEVFSHFTPTYSKLCPVWERGEMIGMRMKARLADYAGDKEAMRADIAASANLLSGLGQILGTSALAIIEAASAIDSATHAVHTELVRDEGTPQ